MPKPRDRRPSPESEQPPNTALILGMVFGGFAGFVFLCGGCCFGTMYSHLGTVERQVRGDLTSNKVIKERIGQIQTFELDSKLWRLLQSRGGGDAYVFYIAGEKGSGTIAAVVRNAGGAYFVDEGTLVLSPSGEAYELIEGKSSENTSDPGSMPVTTEPQTVAGNPGDERFAAKVQKALSINSVLTEQLGDIQSLSYDYEQSQNEPGENVFVFHVTGSKAGGRLRAECITLDAERERVVSAELIHDDGQRVQLFPNKPLP